MKYYVTALWHDTPARNAYRFFIDAPDPDTARAACHASMAEVCYAAHPSARMTAEEILDAHVDDWHVVDCISADALEQALYKTRGTAPSQPAASGDGNVVNFTPRRKK